MIVTRDTEYLEAGSAGHIIVHPGDHVGVHGFLRGRSLAAITVRVYPTHVAPKSQSFRGTVVSISHDRIDVRVGKQTTHARLTSATPVRTGSRVGSIRDIRPGDRVLIRVTGAACCLVVEHVHIYRHKPILHHLKLKGSLTSVSAGQVVVLSGGKRYAVVVDNKTTIYSGRTRSGPPALITGARVTVYACCAGTPLTATSIHVSLTRATVKSVTVHGSVTATGRGTATVTAGGKYFVVAIAPSTRVDLGSSRVGAPNIRVGDYISVRGPITGGHISALRIHIYPDYRTIHHIRGRIISVTTGAVSVRTRGKALRITITASTSFTIGKNRVSPSGLHAGYRVTVTARLTSPGTYTASAVAAQPPALKVVTVRGVVLAVGVGWVNVMDARGRHWRLTISPGVHPTLHGKAALPGMVFPGVHLTARGAVQGTTVAASTVSVHLTTRTVTGRVVSVASGRLGVRAGRAKAVSMSLPAGIRVSDSGRISPVGSLRVGTFVSVHLYEATRQVLRAASIAVVHPTLDFTATVRATSPQLMLRTSSGDTYVLRLMSSSQLITSRSSLPLQRDDIPLHVHAHLVGVALSDGTAQVKRLSVTLHSRELRGTLGLMTAATLQVHSTEGDILGRILPTTTFAQGSHPMDSTGLVAGDDVTLSGYDTLPGKMIVRAVLVHRRIVGISGQVGALTATGFVLNGADGPHIAVFTDSVIWTGVDRSTLSVGLSVHITGYLRGDASVLLTRVRAGK